jgi:hypothetical protein
VRLGIALSEVRKETKFPEKMFLNVSLFSVPEWFETSFQRFFLLVNGSERYSERFYLLQNGSERNSEHFYLTWNGSERNYEVPSVFIFYKMVRNGIRAFLSYAEWLGRKFRVFPFREGGRHNGHRIFLFLHIFFT